MSPLSVLMVSLVEASAARLGVTVRKSGSWAWTAAA
jgi:hypothetical protein